MPKYTSIKLYNWIHKHSCEEDMKCVKINYIRAYAHIVLPKVKTCILTFKLMKISHLKTVKYLGISASPLIVFKIIR